MVTSNLCCSLPCLRAPASDADHASEHRLLGPKVAEETPAGKRNLRIWVKAYMPGNIFRFNPQWFEANWSAVWEGMGGRTWYCDADGAGPNRQLHLVPPPGGRYPSSVLHELALAHILKRRLPWWPSRNG